MSDPTGHIDPGLLVRYEDDQLDARQRSSIDDHVRTCGVCRAELALAREYTSRAVGARLGPRSDALEGSLRNRLDARFGPMPATPSAARPHPPRRTRWLSRGLLAASVAVIALGVYQLQKPSPLSDLGRATRAPSAVDRVSVTVEREGEAWRLFSRMDEGLRDPRVLVVTSGGEVALERIMAGEELSFTPADLGEFASAEALFVQVVATDALGQPVRSRPERLP